MKENITLGDIKAPLFPETLAEKLSTDGLLAVLSIENTRDAVPLAQALVASGVRIMELALRTPVAFECLKLICKKVPEMVAGVGTILSADQMRKSKEIGAAFGVSPGFSRELIYAASEINFPYAPGVMTPSDVQDAVIHGCRFLKFFPAETGGGVIHLRSMNAPFAHLNLQYIVLGGLNSENAETYLAEPCVSVLGGSWIAPKDLISKHDWQGIQDRAREARSLVDKHRSNRNS